MTEISKRQVNRKECLTRYKNHMEKVRGLANETQRSYLLIARRFLESLSSTCSIKYSAFSAAAVVEFVRCDAAPRTGQGPNTTAASMRSFLRFLISQGIVEAGVDAAVPKIRCYRQATLPTGFSDLEIKQILTFSNNGTRKGHRDYALLLLISRLALRVDEAAKLTLDDFDWSDGFIVVRAGKNRCERKLPLAQDLAEAILNYLRQSRPKTDDRHIFLHWEPPFKGYQGSSLGKVIKRLLTKAGLSRPSGGSHLFRHFAATNLVNHGVSFKEIADLLGHQSLATTAIYAKLDFESLTSISLAWPEVK